MNRYRVSAVVRPDEPSPDCYTAEKLVTIETTAPCKIVLRKAMLEYVWANHFLISSFTEIKLLKRGAKS